jgi:uncharacterized protein (DUF2147 family)
MWFAVFARAGVAVSASLLASTSSFAASDPNGVWFDHNGRGAVEIKECADGKGLCGYVVHVKEQRNAGRCGLQILGNVTEGGGGWIYSPERKRKYSVVLKRLSDDKLRVVGNAGSSFFSRTFTWTRAPDDVARCGETTAAAAPAANPAPKQEAVTNKGAVEDSRAAAPEKELVQKADENVEMKAAAESPASSAGTKAAASSAPATKTAAAEDQEPKETRGKRKCSYRIPYVGRTISVPCRD